MQTVSDVWLKRICTLDTTAFSAIAVLDDNYIHLLTYFTYRQTNRQTRLYSRRGWIRRVVLSDLPSRLNELRRLPRRSPRRFLCDAVERTGEWDGCRWCLIHSTTPAACSRWGTNTAAHNRHNTLNNLSSLGIVQVLHSPRTSVSNFSTVWLWVRFHGDKKSTWPAINFPILCLCFGELDEAAAVNGSSNQYPHSFAGCAYCNLSVQLADYGTSTPTKKLNK